MESLGHTRSQASVPEKQPLVLMCVGIFQFLCGGGCI